MTADLRKSAFCGHLRSGQSILEYAVLIAVVAAALLAMNVYIRRSVQGNLKALEDQINADAIK